MPDFAIAGRAIGPGHPSYIIAELSANHGQRLERALELVRAAAAAGVDAVKLQTYTPDTITLKCDAAPFRIAAGTIWDGRTLHDLYAEAYTPWEWHAPLISEARRLGLACFSSPFDDSAVTFLETLAVPAWKIASFELVDLPLIRRCAATGTPLIMSTGMATREEITEAVTTARQAGCTQLALLKCTSAYPSPPGDIHLRTIPALAADFQVVAGLSDHTAGSTVPVAAVAMGAAIIEKHLTLRRSDGGPDASFSLEPAEFRELVRAVREAEAALGTARYEPTSKEAASRGLRRSLFVVTPVKAGEMASAANVRSIRPGHGLHTRHYEAVLGKRFARDLPAGTPLAWEHLV